MSRSYRFEYTEWKETGKRIKMYREQLGMSKEKFAEKINRSENFITDMEEGRKGFSVHTLHQVSKALKVSTDELLYGKKVEMNKKYENREIIKNIIDRCSEEELEVLKDVIVAIFPNLDEIMKHNPKK